MGERNSTDRWRGVRARYRLGLAQRLVPFGARWLPRIGERPARFALSVILRRWIELCGLRDDGARATGARRAFQMALPDQDADRLMERWTAARSDALASSLVYLARWVAGRPSRTIRPRPSFRLPPDLPCVVGVLHYSIDPVVSVACLEANGASRFRCAYYPPLPGTDDDRELWFANTEVPKHIAETLLPITDPWWLPDALAHLSHGGSVMVALDAPFDSVHGAATRIDVGHAHVPLARSAELFARLEGVQLAFAFPERVSSSSWELGIVFVDDIEALARAAAEWIATHRDDWAGWPYITWRCDVLAMRRHAFERSGEVSCDGRSPRRRVGPAM